MQLCCKGLSLRLMKLQINWNAIGFSTSVACAIHCALLPFFINALPLLGLSILDNVFFDAGMILIAILIGGFSLWHGYKKHHHKFLPLLSFFTGMSLLILKHFFTTTILWLVIPSSVLIIFAYYLNWKYCRLAKHCHSSDCNH